MKTIEDYIRSTHNSMYEFIAPRRLEGWFVKLSKDVFYILSFFALVLVGIVVIIDEFFTFKSNVKSYENGR